jgi:hypothetical protein
MASLGEDIKEVYTEEGSATTIISRDPVVTDQWVIYDINSQATKPFIREHHLDATFPYDSEAVVGDVLNITELNRNYLVMNKTPEMFEDEVVEWSVVLYLCNLPVTAHILRPVEVRDNETLKMISGWQVIKESPVYGLITDRLFGSQLEENVRTGQNAIYRLDFYYPASYDLKPLDRVFVSETEYYKIENIQRYNFPSVCMALLVEDTRPKAVVIDGDIYDD